jgi:WD40 repeat protein
MAGSLELQAHADSVTALTFAPDGRELITATASGVIGVWDTETWTTRGSIRAHRKGIHGLALDPAGRRLFTASVDRTVGVWSYPELAQLDILKGHRRAVTSVAVSPAFWGSSTSSAGFSPPGMHLASAGSESALRLWDVSTGRHVAEATGNRRSISQITFHPTEDVLVSTGFGGVVGIWRVPSLELYTILHVDGQVAFPAALSPDGRLLACCGFNRRVSLWDSQGWVNLGAIEVPCRGVVHVEFSRDGRRLIAAGRDLVMIIDIEAGDTLVTASTRGDAESHIAVSPTGEWLVKSARRGWIRMWRLGVFDMDAVVNATTTPDR